MAYERSIYSDMYSPNNMFGVTNTNAANNLNNQTAYLPGTDQDKMMQSLYEMKSTYGDTPAYQQNLQKDWDNYKKTGEPLSLPKKEYSGVEGFASLNNGNVIDTSNPKVNLAGFSKAISETVNKKDKWNGTFIILAFK